MKPLTYSQALTGFFLTAQARRLSSHTIADYSQTLDKKFRTFLEKDYLVDQITAEQVQAFLAAQTTIGKKTLLNYHTALSAFWTWAVREKIATEHVVRGVQAPKPEIPDVLPYNEQEIRAMLGSLERTRPYNRRHMRPSDHALHHVERNRALILFLIDTGVRNEELCNIKLRDVDKRNQRVYIMGKGARERHVPFSVRTHQALWRYLATRPEATPDEPLFLLQNGRAFGRHRLLDLMQAIGARASVTDVTVHRFRHTCAIQYLRNGGDPYTLQHLLGHSSLEMVRRYLNIVQRDIDNVHRRASPVDNWAL
jgi:site-specific recombinase XerD